jgi:hypothetical protein
MKNALLSLSQLTIEDPKDPEVGSRKLKMITWRKVIKYRNIMHWIKTQVKSLYSLIWGKCSATMKQSIEYLEYYN